MKRWLVILSLVLVSCSKVSMGLRYFEYSLKKEVNALFDFEQEKHKQSELAIDQFLRSSKAKMLPVFSERLLQLKEKPNVDILMSELPTEFKRLHADAVVVSDAVVEQIDEDTFQALLKNYEKKIQKDEERHKDLEKSNEALKERTYKGLDYFFGDLNESQKSKVETFFQKERYPFQLQIENKKQNLVRLEKTGGDRKILKSLAKEYIESPEKLELPLFSSEKKAYFKKLAVLINELLLSLSEKQKQHFHQTLQSLSEDLLKIAVQAK